MAGKYPSRSSGSDAPGKASSSSSSTSSRGFGEPSSTSSSSSTPWLTQPSRRHLYSTEMRERRRHLRLDLSSSRSAPPFVFGTEEDQETSRTEDQRINPFDFNPANLYGTAPYDTTQYGTMSRHADRHRGHRSSVSIPMQAITEQPRPLPGSDAPDVQPSKESSKWTGKK